MSVRKEREKKQKKREGEERYTRQKIRRRAWRSERAPTLSTCKPRDIVDHDI